MKLGHGRRVWKRLIAVTVVALLLALNASADDKTLSKWPKGSSPQEIGKRVTERFLATPHTNFGKPEPAPFITYPESVTWYGALNFAQLSGEKDLSEKLIQRLDPLFGVESNLVPAADHVDKTVFGIVPLQAFLETRDQKYLELGKTIADKQWEDPQPDGLTKQTRYWIDDMFMITAVQLQAYRATGESKYLDRAALEMTSYLDKLQQPNGLFYHAPDVPFFWGRGDGWVAAGMAEMLRSLPANHPNRARIMEGYRKMMASLLKYQDKNGMWHQLIDRPEAWPESSSSAMFTFAMITGVKNGWLEKKMYGRAARKGWLGVISYLDADANLREVCIGTGKKNDLQYYLDRPRVTGDLHGQAPVLWCAAALLR